MSNHTPAPWPAPDMQKFAWASGNDLRGGVLSLADYLHAQACVNFCAEQSGLVLKERAEVGHGR